MDIISTFKKTFYIKFQLYPTEAISEWTNILHMKQKDVHQSSSDQILSLWFRKNNGVEYRIHFSKNGLDSYKTEAVTTTLILNTWNEVIISQNLDAGVYKFKLYINSNEVLNKENTTPQEFKNILLFVGDKWATAQHGYIKELYIHGNMIEKFYYFITLILVYFSRWMMQFNALQLF